MPRFLPSLLIAILLSGCALEPYEAAPAAVAPAEPQDPLDPLRDYHSHARPQDFRTEHIVLDLRADFERRVLAGTVELRGRRSGDSGELVLDTRDLDVAAAESATADGPWMPASFRLDAPDPVLGSALRVALPPDATRVRIHYATRPGASGLQWVEPAQTAGKRHPFLYTQSQAIHARSWIPLQDTPQVRATYEAVIRAPRPLTAAMSAAMDRSDSRQGAFRFRMPQPVPSYLIALAVGELRQLSVGPRSAVYAERSVANAAMREFADAEQMIETCERLFGPYRWGRYDMLVLPPSFPYGGMENPRLTFLTPTVIAGDRSGVALIAHELAHSWSGNLVTNATWRDFWLNEGFTNHLTYRIMEEVYGKRRGDMERTLGFQALRKALAQVERPGDRALAYDVRGRDPDDLFSQIPYQRGALFLAYLESRFGREAFDAFLRSWFEENAFRSRTTEEFVAFLDERLLARRPGIVTRAKVDEWIYAPGMPDDAVLPSSPAFDEVDARRTAWLEGRLPLSKLDTGKWSAHEWRHFLDNLPASTTTAQLAALDERFRLTRSTNNLILADWLRQAIIHEYEPAYPRIEAYLLSTGRMRLITPLYRALVQTPAGRARAERIYALARPGYHPIARSAVERAMKPRDAGAA